MNKRIPKRAKVVILACAVICLSGCAWPTPLSYVALNRPTGRIVTTGRQVQNKHPRGGFYFGNAGFRPAPDIGTYIQKAQTDANTDVLRNADVQLQVPFFIDILFFGYNTGTDTVKAGQ